jgi:hypothetical protein
MTTEHVRPSFLYRKHPGSKFGFHRKAGKFVAWEVVVRDVCAGCNNGVLSRLDAYGEQFYRTNRCGHMPRFPERVQLQYDYHQLLRWLLKISFNSARMMGDEIPALRQCVPYILTGHGPVPSVLMLEVLSPLEMGQSTKESLKESLQDVLSARELKEFDSMGSTMPPDTFWLGSAGVGRHFGRRVWFGSFCFYVWFLENRGSRSDRKRERQQLLHLTSKALPDAQVLKESEETAQISVSSVTFAERRGLRPGEGAAWRDYVAERCGKK